MSQRCEALGFISLDQQRAHKYDQKRKVNEIKSGLQNINTLPVSSNKTIFLIIESI